MINKLVIFFSVMMMWATAVQALELGVSFNDSSAQLDVRSQVGTYENGHSLFGVRGLYNDDRDTGLISSSFDVRGPVGTSGLEIGAGLIGYYAETQAKGSPIKDDIAGAGIGAVISFTPPGLEQLRFAGRLYYCPDIFTGLDGEKIVEIGAIVSFEIADNASIYVYYNEIEADIEFKGTRTLDDTVRVGVSIGF
jgi:hypothetical protein